MKSRFVLLFVISLSTVLAAQSAPPVFYAESFRHGTTRIVEEKFDLKLTPQDRAFSERIKDSQGFDHYLLSIIPIGPEGDTTVTAWQVKLSDLAHRLYDNILLTSLQEDAAADPKNKLWLLNPSNFASVPIQTKRIIKVDGFYLVLQVNSYHFTPIDSPYLDSINIAVELTNTDPRSADAPK